MHLGHAEIYEMARWLLVRAVAQPAPVDPISLILAGADRAEEAIDEMIVFQSHAQLAAETALDHRLLDDPEHEHFRDPAAAIFWLYAKRDQPGSADAALVIKQFRQANRNSPRR